MKPLHSSSQPASKFLQHPLQPFSILKRQQDPDALLLRGHVIGHEHLADIRREFGPPGDDDTFDSLSAVPFSQIRERGFQAHTGDEQIRCLHIVEQERISMQELLAILPQTQTQLRNGLRYNLTNAAYEGIIRSVIDDEIGNGEGANFVISREASGDIVDMSYEKALSIFRTLVEQEFGAYMHFLLFDGKNYLIGASPERHLSVEKGIVKMNPISGTLRKCLGELSLPDFKKDLSAFLEDKKEVMELFMVLDEELKMMSQMCEHGGKVEGPFLKEMSKLVHTEYLLTGRSDKDIIDLLRRSMFAPTVSGSPVGNACRIICKYEAESRRYYAGAVVLIGRDEAGRDRLDSAIAIRTMEIDRHGHLTMRAGSTIVRDSDPREEVLETEAKLGALSASIQRQPSSGNIPRRLVPNAMQDPVLSAKLIERNSLLSPFFLQNQEHVDNSIEGLRGKTITIIDNEDDFCFTLRHMIERMGAIVSVVPYVQFDPMHVADIVIIGPGPGNPNDTQNPKIQKLQKIVDALHASGKPFFGVCLGHQMLCRSLELPVERLSHPQQGVQRTVEPFGPVGFYNTFAAAGQEANAVHGSSFASVQFHPESVLSTNGYRVLADSLLNLLPGKGKKPVPTF